MEHEAIKRLIEYHQAALDQYRQHISPSAQHIEEQTIQALKEYDDSIKERHAK